MLFLAMLATLSVDLDGDGKAEKLALDSRKKPILTVWQGKKRLWSGLSPVLQPWKMAVADVDGDGRREVVLGVHKSTRFFPKPHNGLFIWDWNGRELQKKWLGSSLSKPFTDFVFGQLDTDRAEELVSLEMRRDGKLCAVIYSWNGFGFDADREIGAWAKARLVKVEKGRIIVEIAGRRVALDPKGKS